MSETISVKEYERFLRLAPANILQQLGDGMAIVCEHIPENSSEFEALQTLKAMLSMLIYELHIREVEPLWRKAKRFAIRNSATIKEFTIRNSATIKEFTIRNSDTIKEIGKIAACIGGGALIAGPVGAAFGFYAATSQEDEDAKRK